VIRVRPVRDSVRIRVRIIFFIGSLIDTLRIGVGYYRVLMSIDTSFTYFLNIFIMGFTFI
jgi:hypothetical protein